MFKEFKDFAMKGNVVDFAVGIIIGAAFSTIVTSLVNDILMPPIGLLMGKVDFANLFVVLKEGATAGPYGSLAAAKSAGAVVMAYGVFINAIISFLIVALALFFVIKGMNKLKPPVVATKSCPFCFELINVSSTRCAHCTAELTP